MGCYYYYYIFSEGKRWKKKSKEKHENIEILEFLVSFFGGKRYVWKSVNEIWRSVKNVIEKPHFEHFWPQNSNENIIESSPDAKNIYFNRAKFPLKEPIIFRLHFMSTVLYASVIVRERKRETSAFYVLI